MDVLLWEISDCGTYLGDNKDGEYTIQRQGDWESLFYDGDDMSTLYKGPYLELAIAVCNAHRAILKASANVESE